MRMIDGAGPCQGLWKGVSRLGGRQPSGCEEPHSAPVTRHTGELDRSSDNSTQKYDNPERGTQLWAIQR